MKKPNDIIYTSWTGQWENVRIHVCKGTSQKHIDRIKSIMQECGVTNYEIVKQ